MTARYRVGARAFDNPFGVGREQVFGDELPVYTEATPAGLQESTPPPGVHAGHDNPPDGSWQPDPSWSQAQREVHAELLEAGLSPEDAWHAANDLLEHEADVISAKRFTDWTWAIVAGVAGVGLYHLTSSNRRRS